MLSEAKIFVFNNFYFEIMVWLDERAADNEGPKIKVGFKTVRFNFALLASKIFHASFSA